jgi:phosphoribosyl-AMP cyclohydrolase
VNHAGGAGGALERVTPMAKKKTKKKSSKKTAKKKTKKKARRTVMYSSKGKKLYAKRDASGKFKDIQQYSRAHAMDIKRKAADED